MRHQTKTQYFIRTTTFLLGRYGFDKSVEIVRDNRMDCPCCVDNWDDTVRIRIKYSIKQLNKHPVCYVLKFLLHEIGHLINNLSYVTAIDQINSERTAEKFALKKMKKDFSKEYKELLILFKECKVLLGFFKDTSIRTPYYWAYSKIKEYRHATSQEDLKWIQKQMKKIKKL